MLDNPNILTPSYFKYRFWGTKIYYPAFKFIGRIIFCSKHGYKTATEALNRAKEIQIRWKKLYQEKVNEPSKTKSIQDS